MMRLLGTAARRFYLRHPWQLVLAVAGISLGVAVYTGVELANDSARRAFELSSEVVLGRTTHRLLPVGGDLAERVYRELVTEHGIPRAAPVIEGEVRLVDQPGRRYTLLGIDPLKETGFRGYSGWVPQSGVDFTRLMVETGTVLLPAQTAEELGARPGDRLDIIVGGRRDTVRVAGTIQAAPGAEAQSPLVADIATAQELLARTGELTRIDLILSGTEAERLRLDPPAGTTLISAEGGDAAFIELTRAFHTNLTALGLLALVVGAFLIYATMSFAIVQRRETMGVLRAIGVDRRQLLGGVLVEALAIGAIATALGVALGQILAQGLVELVLRTIGDLYFTTSMTAAQPSPWVYARGGALGLGATLVAALGPALDAARTSPDAAMRRAALERSVRRRTVVAALLAPPTLALAGVLLVVRPEEIVPAFAALALVLTAGALLTPLATAGFMRISEGAAEGGFGLPGLMAVRGVTASLSRTGVATAALAVAVGAVVGVGVMISSFRVSLIGWLDTALVADLYVTTADASGLARGDIERIARLAGVEGLTLTRFTRLPTEHGELALRSLRPGPRGWGLDIVEGAPREALAALEVGGAVALAEPLAYRLDLTAGDTVELPTPRGTQAFPVAGVFRDYSTGAGSIVTSLETYRRHWGDGEVTSVGVHLAAGADERSVTAAIRAADPRVQVRSTRDLRELSLVVFDRTFQITEVLRVLVAFVAFLGVLSALLSIQLERAQELGVLRAVGFTPRQLGVLVTTQTGLLGLAAGLMALPLGGALAALLVYVINRRSFGWSMDLVMAPAPMVGGVALAVGAALLAGAYPAWRIVRGRLAGALREE